jgi:hypothetical protein
LAVEIEHCGHGVKFIGSRQFIVYVAAYHIASERHYQSRIRHRRIKYFAKADRRFYHGLQPTARDGEIVGIHSADLLRTHLFAPVEVRQHYLWDARRFGRLRLENPSGELQLIYCELRSAHILPHGLGGVRLRARVLEFLLKIRDDRCRVVNLLEIV